MIVVTEAAQKIWLPRKAKTTYFFTLKLSDSKTARLDTEKQETEQTKT